MTILQSPIPLVSLQLFFFFASLRKREPRSEVIPHIMLRRTLLAWCAGVVGGAGDAPTAEGSSSIGTQQQAKPSTKKIQIAVVGSGPSGCYVADFLTRKNPNIHVDILEQLPVPFGLVRYGVAPDHPEVKNVQSKFMTMFKGGHVSWIGNIAVGKDVPLPVLLDAYSAVVVATGANGDQSLGVPGEELGNVINARQFVNYYNTLPSPLGHPKHCPINLSHTKDVVIIGNGNVAIDVTRVLGTTYKPWCPTDMNCYAVKALMESAVERITVAARRGVEHSAFTIAEFRELTKIQPEQLKVMVDAFDLEGALLRAEQTRAKQRLLELVHKYCATGEQSMSSSPAETAPGQGQMMPATRRAARPKRGPCTAHFRYHLQPVEILPHPTKTNFVGAVRFKRTDIRPEHTHELQDVVIPCDVVVKSVGYRPDVAIKGIEVDDRGCIPHTLGRVKNHSRLYCAGWAKTGPKGVILHSMTDAQETSSTILNDVANGVIQASDDKSGKFTLLEWLVLKKLVPVSIHGLERILWVEKEKGIDLGKAAEKVASITDMMDLALGGKLAKRANDRVRSIQGGRPDALLYLGEFLDDDTDMSFLAAKVTRELPLAIAAEAGLDPKQM